MVQLISCFLEDERGKILEKFNLNVADIIKKSWEVKNFKEKYNWVSSIDPYGNTIFNVHQIPYLTAELENLKKEINDKQIISDVNELEKFIGKIEQHLYIRFVGD